jgi:hypothetical protein
MRLLCRDSHDDMDCPTGPRHDFREGGWTTDEKGVGCFWCRRCGDVRQLMPASISAPELEVMQIETGYDHPS